MNWIFRRHLNADDFVNLIDEVPLSSERGNHLAQCAQCSEKFHSVKQLRTQIADSAVADDDVIEPDWENFRSGVRGALLSRSVRREQGRQSWFGDVAWKPALAWGLSLVVVVGLTSTLLRWDDAAPETAGIQAPFQVTEAISSGELSDVETVAAIAQADVFDDLLELNEDESESLQRLLMEDLASGGGQPQ